MSLFKFSKKKEEAKNAPACACSCGCHSNGEAKNAVNCLAEAANGITGIKVLGAGCKSCREMFESAKQAINNMGLAIEAEYITDMQKVMEYGVMSMPALVVNEKVVSMGKVLKTADIEKLLCELGF